MGTVFMAEQEQPVRRKVALKVIKPGMDTRQVIARFEAERQALAMMDHPNIARVLDAGATETGRPYFVMELVKGVPITEYCDRNHLTPRERLELFLPVCQAIQHAHQKGIIHRDIKPSNVLVELHDGVPVPKVIDFGVAKAIEPEADRADAVHRVRRDRRHAGVHAPGAGRDGRPGHRHADRHLLAGRAAVRAADGLDAAGARQAPQGGLRRDPEAHPRGGADQALDAAERFGRPARPRSRRSGKMEPARLTRLVRGDLDWIVMKALEKERDRRYETAGAFAADVQRFLDQEPVEAGPPTASYRLRRFVRRNRRAVVVGAVIATLLVAVAVISVIYATEQVIANKKISGLAADLGKERESLRTSLRQSNRLLAIRNFDRGQAAFEKGEIGPGMLWMIESWRSAVDAGDPAWQHAARANLAAWRPHYPRLKSGPVAHAVPVFGAAFSPDGRTVISGSMDGTAQLWDVASGQSIGPSLQQGGQLLASRRSAPMARPCLTIPEARATRHSSGMRPPANRSAPLCACGLKSTSWPLQSSPRGRSCWWGPRATRTTSCGSGTRPPASPSVRP